MDALRLNKDEVALEMFGTVFSRLSSWAQRDVEHVIEKMEPPKRSPALPNKEMTLQREADELASRLEQAELENEDLWQENEELKMEIESLKTQIPKSGKTQT